MTSLEMLSHLDMTIGTASPALVRRAWLLADDEGTIQAHQMLTLTDDPRKHTTTNLSRFLLSIGCERNN